MSVALAALLVAAGCNGSSSGPAGSGVVAAEAGPPGAYATSYASDERFTSLVVEVDYAPGLAPQPESLAMLEARLRAWCLKPEGVTVRLGSQLDDAKAPRWTLEALRALEGRHRTLRSIGSAAALHVVLVDGASDRDTADTPLLGVSLSATAFAVFARTVHDDRPAFVSCSELEAAVLVHEAGHLLGQVGLDGLASAEPHEDPARHAHCREDGCIMNAQSTRWDFIRVDLCAKCAADVATRARGDRSRTRG